MKRVRVDVRGWVQGVGFRDTCRTEALRRDVAGWVRNTSAGTVEAEFEGVDADVDAMIAWCRQGPPTAAVDHVTTTEQAPTGASHFEVR